MDLLPDGSQLSSLPSLCASGPSLSTTDEIDVIAMVAR
jgi:hypothetical protein